MALAGITFHRETQGEDGGKPASLNIAKEFIMAAPVLKLKAHETAGLEIFMRK